MVSKVLCIAFVFCAATAIVSPAQSFTNLVNFDGAHGAGPYASFVQAPDGNFYGTTNAGGTSGNCNSGTGCGTVFKITPGGTLTTLYNFCAQTGCTDGSSPQAALVLATDGNFYGTTQSGGSNNCGTVFKISPGGTLTTLHRFGYTDGAFPQAALVQATDGNFYGTAFYGGAYGYGTVFEINPGGTLTTLYSFFCAQAGCLDGAHPSGTLVQATNGNFYGTTVYGGASGYGTVFEITSGGTLTTLYSFCAQAGCPDGANPWGTLVQATDGNFYGTTLYGGANTNGTVFEITAGGTLSTLHSFDYTDGYAPYGGLVQASDGSFYGTTNGGGAMGDGTAYRLDVGLGVTLSVSTVGSGAVTSSDGAINCGTVCSSNYKTSSLVTLTATPALGWAFTSWTGCDAVQNNVCTVTMNNARNVTATFKVLFSLSVSATGSGAVTSADGYINCGAACSHSYLNGSMVTLTATPAQNWALTSWSGCDAVHGNICIVSMYKARSVTATFKITYLVSVSTTGSGTVFGGDGHINCGSACSYSYPSGTTLGLTAMPGTGSTLSNWSNCTSIQGNVCFVAVISASSVSAAFSPVQIAFSSLTLNPSTVRHRGISVGTLTLGTPAPSGGVTIGVKSSQPGSVSVPSIIYIPGGLSSFRFGARVIGLRPATVTITATDGNTSVSGQLRLVP